MKTVPPAHRIALLFNGGKVYDRGIITGIGNYLSSTRASWDLFLEEYFLCRLKGIERWQGDGIIADFDNPAVAGALASCSRSSWTRRGSIGVSATSCRTAPPVLGHATTTPRATW